MPCLALLISIHVLNGRHISIMIDVYFHFFIGVLLNTWHWQSFLTLKIFCDWSKSLLHWEYEINGLTDHILMKSYGNLSYLKIYRRIVFFLGNVLVNIKYDLFTFPHFKWTIKEILGYINNLMFERTNKLKEILPAVPFIFIVYTDVYYEKNN